MNYSASYRKWFVHWTGSQLFILRETWLLTADSLLQSHWQVLLCSGCNATLFDFNVTKKRHQTNWQTDASPWSGPHTHIKCDTLLPEASRGRFMEPIVDRKWIQIAAWSSWTLKSGLKENFSRTMSFSSWSSRFSWKLQRLLLLPPILLLSDLETFYLRDRFI